jgi:hypothetical protein
VVLWKPDWKRGPKFRAPNSGDNQWLSRWLIPFRRVLFFVRDSATVLLLRLTSTASRGGRVFLSSHAKDVYCPSLFDKTSCSPNAIRLIPKNQPSGSSEAKPVTDRNIARTSPIRRDGVEGGGTQRQRISTTGETLFGPGEATPTGREAYKDEIRKRRIDAEQGVGGGHSTDEARENRAREGPLLPSCVQRRERQPECPREGRLNTGPVKPGAKRPLDSTMPANFRGRYTEWPSNSDLLFLFILPPGKLHEAISVDLVSGLLTL